MPHTAYEPIEAPQPAQTAAFVYDTHEAVAFVDAPIEPDAVCYICAAGDGVFKACRCNRVVHPHCLEKWLIRRAEDEYERTHRPTPLPSNCEICYGHYVHIKRDYRKLNQYYAFVVLYTIFLPVNVAWIWFLFDLFPDYHHWHTYVLKLYLFVAAVLGTMYCTLLGVDHLLDTKEKIAKERERLR